jgi:hypothetical protein
MTQAQDMREEALGYLRHQSKKSLGDLAALMERTAADCARCLEDVSEAQAGFKHDDEWSMKEVLEHMLGSSRGVNREISNLVEGKTAALEARMGLTGSGERPVEELRQALADLWVETGRLVAALPEDADLERTWEHPLFGALNFKEWIAFQRMHALDHVQQMYKLKSHPDYPRSPSTGSRQA